MLRFALHSTLSGALELPVEVASSSWNARLETNGDVKARVKFRDVETRIDKPTLSELTEPTGEFTIVAHDGDFVAAAGVVTASDMDDDAGTIEVTGKDFGDHYWPGRMGAGVDDVVSGGMSYSGRSASGAVRHVIGQALSHGSQWEAPIILPADGVGDFNADDPWYAFRYVSEQLDEIRKRGVEIHLAPRLTDGSLEYVTRVGSPITVGSPLLLVRTAQASVISGLRWSRNGQDLITGGVAVGNGEGTETVFRTAGDPPVGVPIRDTIVTGSKSVRDGDTLQSIVDATVAERRLPARSFSFDVRLSDDITVADVFPGALVTLDIRGHEVIPDGQYPHRVIAVGGDEKAQKLTPEVVPYGS